MADAAPSHGTSDFRPLDFDRLWKGRGSTIEVERGVLGDLLAGTDARRVLEVGTGTGRLTPVLRELAREYVGLDLHREFLLRIPGGAGPVRAKRVVADAHHSPFVDGAFTVIVLVRVYNFLPQPSAFLGEMRRLLAPGGRLVVGYQPRPSIASLVDDVRLFLANERPPGAPSLTFSRAPRVAVPAGPFPCWMSTRRAFRATMESAGFATERAVSTGLEDYAGTGWIPGSFFRNHARAADRIPVLPTQFVRARRLGGDPSRALPPWEEMLACPTCRTPLGGGSTTVPELRICPECGTKVEEIDDLPPGGA